MPILCIDLQRTETKALQLYRMWLVLMENARIEPHRSRDFTCDSNFAKSAFSLVNHAPAYHRNSQTYGLCVDPVGLNFSETSINCRLRDFKDSFIFRLAVAGTFFSTCRRKRSEDC